MSGSSGSRGILGAMRLLLGDRGAQRYRHNRAAMLGLVIAGVLLLFAIVGPLVVQHDPNTSDFSLSRDALGAPPGPSTAHWLGTDPLFRDLLARLAYGARISLLIAASATFMSTALGSLVGIVSGMAAGSRLHIVDGVLMRVVDVVLALPYLLLITAIGVAVQRADVGTTLLVLGLTSWTGAARIVRGKTMALMQNEFVEAARALGAGPMHIARRHVLPNIAGTLLVLATVSLGQMILAEAILGYLGVGVQPPRATWGRMLFEAESYLGTKPLLIAAPGFAILLSVLAFSRVGEGVRDALEGHDHSLLQKGRRLPADLMIAASALLLVTVATPNRIAPPIGHEPADEQPTRGGTLHLATAFNVRTLDPALAYDEAANAIEELLFARLVTWDRDGNIALDLARELLVDDSGRNYAFNLRRGVRFHDGAELRAHDVKRSIERALHSDTPCPGASQYDMIVGFDEFHSGKAPHLDGVIVVDDDTVVIQIREADATFLPRMTLGFMAPICPSSGERVQAQDQDRPCGAGPFRLDHWERDGSIRLVRHDGYFQPGRPYLDAIEWVTGVRASTQRYKFEAGEIDFVRELTTTDAAVYKTDASWSGRGRWVVSKETTAIFLNTEMPPFDQLQMRRAVQFAVDPSVLEKLRPDVMAVDRVLPQSIPGPSRQQPLRRYDPARALEEMAAAGYPFDPDSQKGGYPRIIDFITVPDSFDQAAAEVFQQQLARVGIRIRLKLVSNATYLAEISRRRTATMGRAGWGADFPDPSNFFEPTLSTQAIQDEGSQNYAFFSSGALDQVLAAARKETDRDKRFAYYAKAEQIVCDLAPWVPTHTARRLELWQPYLRGYKSHAVISPRFNDVWLHPDARPSPRLTRHTLPAEPLLARVLP